MQKLVRKRLQPAAQCCRLTVAQQAKCKLFDQMNSMFVVVRRQEMEDRFAGLVMFCVPPRRLLV